MIVRFSLAALFIAVLASSTRAQTPTCLQSFPGGQSPAFVNPKLGRRTTMLCNAAYVVLASGVTHGALWSAEHPTAASLAGARGIRRDGEFHPDDRPPSADQAQLSDWFCQRSRQFTQASSWKLTGSRVLHDPERNSGTSCKSEAAEGSGDGLVVTETRAEEISELAVFAAEAVGGVAALETAHTSDPALDAAMVLLKPVVQVRLGAVADRLTQHTADCPGV